VAQNKIKDGNEGTLVPSFFLNNMILEQQIHDIIKPKLAESDNYIVAVNVKQGNKIVVLMDNDKGIAINDCIAMSRHIESNLDREVEDFELSVMSAGLSEPFLILRQYIKNLGQQVEVKLVGGKKMTGKLLSADEKGIALEVSVSEKLEGKKKKELIIKTVNVLVDEIKETKLVLLF
jgi:ribosome maturation factor RimP